MKQMQESLISFQTFVKNTLKVIGLLLLCFIVPIGSVSAQAANPISPQLEEQVLQIIRKHPEVVVESVQAYQQRQQEQLQEVRQAFVQTLQTNPKVVIRESPMIGASDLKHVLVEFSDFQCPYCAQTHKILKEFIAKHQNEVTLVYKHFPLTPIHSEAMPAAKAAWAAGRQGKFWEYHDALFSEQDKLGEPLYVEIATKLNLDLEKFEQDRANADKAIEEDVRLAQTLGLSGTPFLLMDGEGFSGDVQLADLEKALAGAS